jgi:hypothetical protein
MITIQVVIKPQFTLMRHETAATRVAEQKLGNASKWASAATHAVAHAFGTPLKYAVALPLPRFEAFPKND